MSGYTGKVRTGGPADVRKLEQLVIRKVSVGPQDNNAYLLTCTATGAQLLIDAADDVTRLVALVREGTGALDVIVTTHQHWDHHRALAQLVERTGARTAAGTADAAALPVPVGQLLEHEDEVRFGQATVQVVHLRGHTPGSVALVYRDPAGPAHAFTGDSLFPGGVGNTDHDPQRFAALIEDVEHRLFDVLPDDTWVYPGHGGDTQIGAERPLIAAWRARGW